MKTILGLDLGTNSIGWALIQQDFDKKEGKIIDMGSRIIPMSQDILANFDKGVSVSQTAERTAYRGVRRLRERHLLRRERLHQVLHILDFLPQHYAEQINFKDRPGKFITGTEPKLPYKEGQFLFKSSYLEMLQDFKEETTGVIYKKKDGEQTKIPYDWTIYYLRKKALLQKIEKEELAWIILNFNQKRGYYQLRGEEEEETTTNNKKSELYTLQVTKVSEIETNAKGQKVYKIELENGWEFNKPSSYPVNWEGKVKDFIVTIEYELDGSVKKDKDGKEKRSFRAPKEDDWNLVKVKTEKEIENSGSTVGTFIYNALLKNPTQKIRGKLVQTIERKRYKEELRLILEKQKQFHSELSDNKLFNTSIQTLYKVNEAHKKSIQNKDFFYLFIEDIIFYQRPLKSKKRLISNCRYEFRTYLKDGKTQKEFLKVIPRSHPLFQEFRLWQWIHNLRIQERETEKDSTTEYLKTGEDYAALFEYLSQRKEIDQKALLKYFKLSEKDFCWNYLQEGKKYPCYEIRTQIISYLEKVGNISDEFLTPEVEFSLWHILYSVSDKQELKKALKTFALKNKLPEEEFSAVFSKFPVFSNDYAAYSEKAVKKLLPIMRRGKYWNKENLSPEVLHKLQDIKERLQTIQSNPEKLSDIADDELPIPVLKSFINTPDFYSGLNTYQACYAVYGRHSEEGESLHWNFDSLEKFVKEFKQHSLRNPIVEQIVTETLRVVKDVWKTYGEGKENFFDEIHVELGREMKNPADKRKQITDRNLENENTNLRIKALLAELFTDKEVAYVRPYSPSQVEILKIYEEFALSNEERFDKNIGRFIQDPPSDEIIKISRTAQPTTSQLQKYKLWLNQRYRSPYTGQVISLAELFTVKYQIEHIIPQSRYFDDSLSNKIICEAEVNKEKGNFTAYEFMDERGGDFIDLSEGGAVPLLTLDEYEKFVQKYFTGNENRLKKKKLLMAEIPESMIERQLNDSRYISKYIKNLLSNIVREKDEKETTSKNLVTASGSIIAVLRKDWGLEDIWNELITPRFQRLNKITTGLDFGDINSNTNKFLPTVPLEYARGFSKKRIDHRHHALDALVIACLTKDHVNYITSLNTERKNYSLVEKLRKQVDFKGNKVAKDYLKPWGTFTQEVREKLNQTVVSFKKNTRIINKTVNHYQVLENGKKVIKKQEKGDSWAIRKPLHKETVYGKVRLQRIKEKPTTLSLAIENWEMIAEPAVKKIIKEKADFYKENLKGLKKYFKDHPVVINGEKIEKVKMYERIEATAGRTLLDNTFDEKKIGKITDLSIQKILLQHLSKYKGIEDEKGKTIPSQELAFSEAGLEELNSGIKKHKPIYKVRIYEEGNKFALGETGNKKDKYIESAKGTNLFFALYADSEGKRSYETISLHKVIEIQKLGALEKKKPEESYVPETNDKGDRLLFYLSPNDLVYVPEVSKNTNKVSFDTLTSDQQDRVYKMVSCTGNKCFFIKHEVAVPIVNKLEFTTSNKMEKSIEGQVIKESCWKLEVNRLGQIEKIYR